MPCQVPRAKRPELDGDDERHAEKRRLDVGRHVIGTFQRVLIGKILGSQCVGQGFQVISHFRGGVFIDRQGGRRVLEKQV